MGSRGQRDQFAEAHLSAPALFTHYLRSERRASQELSCSHNTTTLHIGGGDTEGSLWWYAPPATGSVPPTIHHLQTKPNKRQKRLRLARAFALEARSALMPRVSIQRKYMKA